MLSALLFLVSVAGPIAHAQQGILPGEPDPNVRTRNEHDDAALIDDRAPCKKGLQRIQKMKCGTKEDSKQECDNYSPVLECRKKPQTIHCKKPQMPVPIYRCE